MCLMSNLPMYLWILLFSLPLVPHCAEVRCRFVTILNWCCVFEDISFDVAVEVVFMAMLHNICSPRLDGNIK